MLRITVKQRLYTTYCAVIFLALGLSALIVNLVVPAMRTRRAIAGAASRAFLRAAGIELRIEGIDRLPQTPCVVVANHASYIDGIVAIAALPPEFAFVIKTEMNKVPLAGLMLRGIGSEFVERFNRHKGAVDARRVLRVAAAGQSLVFFPEGTFDDTPHIGRFQGGAFTTASRSNLPVVAVAIHGAREVMHSSGMLLARKPIRFEILAVLEPHHARLLSREMIATAVGEPLAP